jgi:exosortase/archaeosortase family protein
MKIYEKYQNFGKQNPGILFFLKLILFYNAFYYFTIFWSGICDPRNLYWSFADKYLNYIQWLRDSLRFATGILSSLFGYETYTHLSYKIGVVNGYGVLVYDSCLGYGIMSVWAAFALAFPANTKKKIKWLVGGLFAIWFINVLRILALLLAVNQGKKVDINKFGEHHDVFNAFAYGLIVLMIYFYTKSSTKKPQKPQQ